MKAILKAISSAPQLFMAKKRSSSQHRTAPSKSQAPQELAPNPSPQPEKSDFLIVGVGASAGGLDAFSQLLHALPAEPKFATVIVQHLSPQHESALPALLGGSTAIPIESVDGDVRLEPGKIYVVPPNKTLGVMEGELQLLPRPMDNSQFLPIDAFFQSLAAAMGKRAVGVILSGMGFDGTVGVEAIKAAGGITIAQDPESAKYDSMPRAAVATGRVDLVLNPVEIADELLRLSENPAESTGILQLSRGTQGFREEHLDRIFTLLRQTSGVDFSQYKLPTVQRRIQRRMALHKVSSVEHYIRYLEENPAETGLLYQDILIHVTRFFREPESFAALAHEFFPALLSNRRGDQPLRVWAPGCSTGEEAYSLAIALVEVLEQHSSSVPIQIFATDVSERAIEVARSGMFLPTIAEDVSPERLRKFFTKTDGYYRINKTVRDVCVFARQDLTRDPPFSRLDLIVCRNVLIYLGQAVQSRLIHVFHYALKPTGYLVLGSAETVGVHGDLFAVADKKHRVYRKKVSDVPAMQFSEPYTRPSAAPRALRNADQPRATEDLQSEVNRLVLERYAPPGVVVDGELRIVQFRGQTGKFLEPAPGDASLNLLKMCREGLLHSVRTAIQNAKKTNQPVRREGVRVLTNGEFTDVAVEVVPLGENGESRHCLVLFQETAQLPKEHKDGKKKRVSKAQQATQVQQEEFERLQAELVANREYLQSIIQDLESANEELQSANEEILSSNEELQSTNEELDTAKEELQSTNEELNTVNEELHGRNDELGRINSDLVNLLNGIRIAIVIVANDLRIRRFTPMAERVLNLIPGDIGRPIGQIKPDIDCPDLEQLITEAIDSVSVQNREVQDAQGRWFALTIRPYKNLDNRIDGAVLSLFDIDEVRRHETQAAEAREYAETILKTVHDAVLVVDGEMRIQGVSDAFCKHFHVSKSELENGLLHEVCHGQWNIPKLSELVSDVQQSRIFVEDVEFKHEFPGLSLRTIRVNARRAGGVRKPNAFILLAMDDVTPEQ